MKDKLNIAIPVEDSFISADFEACETFFCYEIHRKNGQKIRVTLLETPPQGIENKIKWLKERSVNILIYDGFNPELTMYCMEKGLTVVTGFHHQEPWVVISKYLKDHGELT